MAWLTVVPSFQVDKTLTPGAMTAKILPKLLKAAKVSVMSDAPIAKAFGSEAGEVVERLAPWCSN